MGESETVSQKLVSRNLDEKSEKDFTLDNGWIKPMSRNSDIVPDRWIVSPGQMPRSEAATVEKYQSILRSFLYTFPYFPAY